MLSILLGFLFDMLQEIDHNTVLPTPDATLRELIDLFIFAG